MRLKTGCASSPGVVFTLIQFSGLLLAYTPTVDLLQPKKPLSCTLFWKVNTKFLKSLPDSPLALKIRGYSGFVTF